MEKDLPTSYLLAAVGLLTPVAGLHHFYLNRPFLGTLYLLTWGFCWIGTIVDLIRMPYLVDEHNLLESARYRGALQPPPPSPEQSILKAAQKRNGALTVTLASVETGLSLDECRRHLESMAKAGYCERDVSETAVDLYVFHGLRSNKPFELE